MTAAEFEKLADRHDSLAPIVVDALRSAARQGRELGALRIEVKMLREALAELKAVN